MKSVKVLTLVAVSAIVMSFNVIPGMYSFYPGAYNAHTAAVIIWKSEVIDLGNIPQGKPVTVQFEFTNKGTAPVIISNVLASCGCTATDYSKKPIAVNEKSIISATYNAASAGAFSKTITVTLDDSETKVLQIKGIVVQ